MTKLGITAASLTALFVVTIIIFPEFAVQISGYPTLFISEYFAHFIMWSVTLVLLANIAIGISPWGKVRLGTDEQRPEFNNFAWFSMLFSAGVGTGILFWGVAEPIFHFQNNPFMTNENVANLSVEAAQLAQRITLFHWGLHGWTIYSFVGLCLGYIAFRRGLPFTVSSIFVPFLPNKIKPATCFIIDLLAVFATLFGIAVTLGLGTSQMASGIEYLFGLKATPLVKLCLVVIVSSIATLSAVSGVSKGIKRISEFNIACTVILLTVIIVSGPTLIIFSSYFTSSWDYLVNMIPMGLWVGDSEERQWQSSWTLFYWGWWIAWGPFVGMFMARVSRGRTLREYILGTLLVPTIAGFFFLTVLGATALNFQLTTGGLVELVNADMAKALFSLFELLDLGPFTWSIALLTTTLIVTWFVTSSDSGTLVISSIVSGGDEAPSIKVRIFWGMAIALVTGLLLYSGGLSALQAMSTAIAVPFTLVLLLMIPAIFMLLIKHESR